MSRRVRWVRWVLVVGLLLEWLVPFAGDGGTTVRAAPPAPVLTHHYDNARTGANLTESVLTTTNVNRNTFGKRYTLPLNGNMFAQPLYVPGLTVGGQTRNVVFAATMHNSIYAYDAESGSQTPLWKTTLADDVPIPMPNAHCCGNLGPPALQPFTDIRVEMGILSTPAIDLATNSIYVVAMSQTGAGCGPNQSNAGCAYRHRIHVLSLATGLATKAPVTITGDVAGCAPQQATTPGRVLFESRIQTQRPALTLANGKLYIAFGSYKDDNPYHGWVMAYNKDTLAQGAVFNTTPNADCYAYPEAPPGTPPRYVYLAGGGFWGSGQGPAVDPVTGNLVLTDGNGEYRPEFRTSGGGNTLDCAPVVNGECLTKGELSDSVLKFDPNLNLIGRFTPYDNETYGDVQACNGADYESGYNCYDLDLGSVNGLFIPGTNLLLATGKIGQFYLIDKTTNFGGRGTGSNNQIVQNVKAFSGTQPYCNSDQYNRFVEGCRGRIYGAPVYWNGPGGPYVYIWPRYDAVKQFQLLPDATHGYKFDTKPDTETPTGPDNFIPYAKPFKQRQWLCCAPFVPDSEYVAELAGAFLSLSANGNQAGSGILWAAVPRAVEGKSDREILHAFDAQDVTRLLWTSDQVPVRDKIGNVAKFQPPLVAGGRVYAASFCRRPVHQQGNYAYDCTAQTPPNGDTDNLNRLHVFGLLPTATATGFPALVAAGDARAVTITVRNTDGTVATDYTGTIRLTSSDPAALLPPPHTYTAGDMGQFSFVVRFRTPGTHSITATDVNANVASGTQAGIKVFGATALSPANGGTGGGGTAQITGVNFAAPATVSFGDTPAQVTGVGPDGTAITVVPPLHAPGTVDVTITINGSTFRLIQAYTYGVINPAPVPTRIAPPTVAAGMPVPMPQQPGRATAPTPGGGATPNPAPIRR